MSEQPVTCIFEETFPQSDKTDAILIVEKITTVPGPTEAKIAKTSAESDVTSEQIPTAKFHINKALLSYHSDYFKTLFASDTGEKSPPEFVIKDVNWTAFGTVLSYIHKDPLNFNTGEAEELLELADRFQLTAAKRFMEFQLMMSIEFKQTKIQIADKFQLNELFNHTQLDSNLDYLQGSYDVFFLRDTYSPHRTFFKSLSDESNVKLFHQLIKVMHGSCKASTKYELQNTYESRFTQSDKTDAILIIGDKKLHVNKALLSHHSDYFDTLFNSEFKEKLMAEIPIEDVKFEVFAALLSLVHRYPIFPTENNVENLLELADRFLLLPSVKRTLEQFLISTKIDSPNKLRIADKYKLDELLSNAINSFRDFSSCNDLTMLPFYQSISDETKTKMSETPASYESTFAQSYKTDAVLVVGEKKLHVNRALLSYHSDYFKTLFDTDSGEKSPPEFSIPPVDFEPFATVLSIIQCNPTEIDKCDTGNLLEVAERCIYNWRNSIWNSISLSVTLLLLQKWDTLNIIIRPSYEASLRNRSAMDPYIIIEIPKFPHIQSDKTDAILVVEGKKLHVNKALLSYHSDYFNVLFNSKFIEKSMKEIPINDVNSEDFTALLSLVQDNPIWPKENNAEILLELADRFLLLPSVKHTLELFIISSKIDGPHKLRIAHKYQMDQLVNKAIESFVDFKCFEKLAELSFYQSLSYDTKVKMSEAPGICIYESTFAQCDKTDAVLVVGEKKLHVNRALLSYHSDYFKTLFDTDSTEKSPPEFPIPDVNFEHFATVLSFVQNNPIKFKGKSSYFSLSISSKISECETEKLLELAEQFHLQLSKFQLELYLIGSGLMETDKIRIADKFKLNELFNLSLPTSRNDYMNKGQGPFKSFPNFSLFKTLSNRTNARLFHQLIKIKEGSCGGSTIYEPQNTSDIYERTFAKSDKTDAILVVAGKKLHVNKTVLSYHSTYFNTLFNGEFKEKSMQEIAIEDVEFEDFVTLLSLIQDNPIFPTEKNAENLLELADRFLLLPSVKHLLELFIISSKIDDFNKIRLADKYKLDQLLTKQLEYFNSFSICNTLTNCSFYENISDDTKVKLFYHMLKYA
ncbi:hypothetical protein CRE_19782 [Caenorhabditis remanei]|uniref:BTB domain-containing protein n=1 Tax=Caenorhabditis remanei TaxID=31234 RepID=E3MTA3_CAERE|nr:hypothetical protein CRE_19782 [Caenorhabditis remanei]